VCGRCWLSRFSFRFEGDAGGVLYALVVGPRLGEQCQRMFRSPCIDYGERILEGNAAVPERKAAGLSQQPRIDLRVLHRWSRRGYSRRRMRPSRGNLRRGLIVKRERRENVAACASTQREE
jgi:hypothetical protein